MKYINMLKRNQKSVKSIHPRKSVIQIGYDIVKANGGVPIAIGMKVKTPPAGRAGKEGEGSEFIIVLEINK